jgi:hypothetical protein
MTQPVMHSSSSPPLPIFEPELNFLPFGCECGSRFVTTEELALHKRETCHGLHAIGWGFDLGGGLGVADGGRKM